MAAGKGHREPAHRISARMSDGVLQLDLPRSDVPWSPSAALPAFVAGPENALVLHPVERLLQGDNLAEAARLYNPLVLVGPSGNGKSQLARAIVRHWRRTLADAEVAYFSAADFSRDLQAARADDRVARWRDDLGRVRLLVVEDLERFRRGAAALVELRQAADAVIDRGGVAVFTADREPALLAPLDAPLRDRLAAGLTVRLLAPGFAARQAILRLAAQERGIALSATQLDELTRNEVHDVASLLDNLAAERDAHTPVQTGHVPGAPATTLKQIMAVAARYFAVTQAALVGPSRRKSLVEARNAVVYLARRLTALSYEKIGRELGGRDHTTIMHAENRVAHRLPGDPVLRQSIEQLERILRC